MTFHGYPRNTGPFWLGWLLYGHFAVVVFITLSGFSLAISPARKGWQLGGKARFAQRRAWRILPPYWAALVFSLIIAWGLQVAQPASTLPNGKSVVVYGLLVQDIFGAPVPNGAFWSIAVEAQLYLVFTILLVILRRFGAAAVLAAVTVPVAAIGLLAPQVSIVDKLMRLTPEFAPLFAIGLLAAGIISASYRIRRLPLQWLAALAAAPVLVLIVVKGSVWTVTNLFWIDLAVGPAIALLLAAVATRRPAPLVWLLGTRPVRSLGTFSYSLYLVHAPIVVALARKFVGPHVCAARPAGVLGHPGHRRAALGGLRAAVRDVLRDPVPAVPELGGAADGGARPAEPRHPAGAGDPAPGSGASRIGDSGTGQRGVAIPTSLRLRRLTTRHWRVRYML